MLLFVALIYLIFFQDYIGLVLFDLNFPIFLIKSFIIIKNILVVVILTKSLLDISLLKIRKRFSFVLMFMFFYFLIIIIYYSFLSKGSGAASDLWSLSFPFICLSAGYFSLSFNNEIFIKHIQIASFISITLGLILYFLGHKTLININVFDYTEHVKGFSGFSYKGLPSTFHSVLGGHEIFRLAASIMNPIATATLFVFSISILCGDEFLSRKRRLSIISSVTIFIGILFTFSRGPILGFFIGLSTALWFWRSAMPKQFLKISIPILTIFFIIFYVGILEDTVSLEDASSRGHYYALQRAWEYASQNLLGSGVGSSGHWKGDGGGVVLENSFAMIVGQVGVVALAFLLLAFGFLFYDFLKYRANSLSIGLFVTFVMLCFNSFFCGALLSVTPLVLFWILVGRFEGNPNENSDFCFRGVKTNISAL